MKNLLIPLLLAFLAACSQPKVITIPMGDDPKPKPKPKEELAYEGSEIFKPYVEKFNKGAIEQGRAGLKTTEPMLTIKLGSLAHFGDVVIGFCTTGDNIREVTISKTFWNKNKNDDDQRLILMMHELSHCVLYRDHRFDLDKNDIPVSIMYPSIMTSKIFNSQNTSDFIRELFHWNFDEGPVFDTQGPPRRAIICTYEDL